MDFDGWKRRHDQTSLSALLETVESRVDRICRRILRDPHDAEEAKQEVLLEISKGIGAVADAGHFDRWVGKVAFRTALDRRRMRLRRTAHESRAAGLGTNGSGPDDAIHEGMSRLDEEDRELLIERYFDRRTLRELAKRRGISAVAVRKRIEKAQDRLKRMLGALGAAFMKAKTAASVAVILVPLLIGGVWFASSRKVNRELPLSTSGIAASHTDSPALADPRDLADTRVHSGMATEASPTPRDLEKEQFLLDLKRYRAMSERASECGRESMRLMRAGTWSKQLTEELEQLEKDMPPLYRELKKQALLFPDVCLEYFQHLEWTHLKKAIGWLLTPVVDAEIENSGTGPILEALLPLAQADFKDRSYLLRWACDLKAGNRALAEICLQAMTDEDPESR